LRCRYQNLEGEIGIRYSRLQISVNLRATRKFCRQQDGKLPRAEKITMASGRYFFVRFFLWRNSLVDDPEEFGDV
jgi:hypothetical protein